VLKYRASGPQFTEMFLASPDFDVATLTAICRSAGLPVVGRRTDLIDRITNVCREDRVLRWIMTHLTARNKGWLSLRLGTVSTLPTCSDPVVLAVGEGEQKWYGPMSHPGDALPTGTFALLSSLIGRYCLVLQL
jgi:hypothetical protein